MGKKLLGKFNRILDGMHSLTAVFCGAMIVFLIIIVCYEVICRYFFNRSLSWVVEISSFIMFFLSFLATGWILKHDRHVRMDLFYDKLKPRHKIMFDAITSFLSMIVCAILVWRGVEVVADLFVNQTRTNTTLMVIQWPLMAIVPFGILLFFLEYLRKFMQSLNQLTEDNKNERTSQI